MRVEDLYPDQQVVIIDWLYDDGRPEHWADDGAMDHWRGEIVTIAEVYEDSEEVYIHEDEHCWQWYPWDFEPYHNLSQDNPNVKYKLHKSDLRLNELRAQILDKQK